MIPTVTFTGEPSMLRGRTVQPAPPAWPTKDPSETVELAVDWSQILPTGVLPLLVVPTISGDPTVILASFASLGSVTTVTLRGGTDRNTATVMFTAAFADGQRLARSVTLPIRVQGVAPTVLPGTLGACGFQLTVGGAAIRVVQSIPSVGGQPISVGGKIIIF